MFAPELVQYLGVGGVARLGLFYRGQTQLLKEDLAQLLGGVDVERAPGQFIDAALQGFDALGQCLTVGDQRALVDEETFALHLSQHLA